MKRWTIYCLLLPTWVLLGGCSRASAPAPSKQRVVVYVAHDRVFSEPILREFERRTGIEVLAKYDTEATKTTQLTLALLNRKHAPEADVFWNNEFANTLLLQKEGVLERYVPQAARDIPSAYLDVEGYWTGIACRARVLLYNTNLVPREQAPKSIHDLAHARFRGKAGIALPLFGTTRTHLAALFAQLGADAAQAWIEALLANEVSIEDGNATVRNKVVEGRLAVCLTDTDDANGALLAGAPVEMVYPDQDGIGTLVIPNTICLIRGGPHAEAGRRLIEYLVSAEVEQQLAASKAAQMPVRSNVPPPGERFQLGKVVAMPVSFGQIAAQLEPATTFVQQRLR
jgi:iron(III) transport system substrate-binding protein